MPVFPQTLRRNHQLVDRPTRNIIQVIRNGPLRSKKGLLRHEDGTFLGPRLPRHLPERASQGYQSVFHLGNSHRRCRFRIQRWY